MDENERHTAGMAVRRRVLGDSHVDRAMAQTTPVTAEFQDLITRYAWGEIWTRPALDVRSRRLVVIGTMVALERWEELRMHVAAALSEEGGLTDIEVKEVLLQQAVYCGVPAAHRAFHEVGDLLAQASSGVTATAPDASRRG